MMFLSVEERVQLIQNGRQQLREELIRELESTVIQFISMMSHRRIERSDDEYSIGLQALDEAIERYDEKRGIPFKAYWERVVRCRLINFWRNEKRQLPQIQQDVEMEGAFLTAEGLDLEERIQMKWEMAAWENCLGVYGIELDDLIDSAPKHRSKRERLYRHAKMIAADPQMREELFSGKTSKAMAEKLGVSRRTLKRDRTYLIGLTLLLTQDLPTLQQYLAPILGIEQERGRQS